MNPTKSENEIVFPKNFQPSEKFVSVRTAIGGNFPKAGWPNRLAVKFLAEAMRLDFRENYIAGGGAGPLENAAFGFRVVNPEDAIASLDSLLAHLKVRAHCTLYIFDHETKLFQATGHHAPETPGSFPAYELEVAKIRELSFYMKSVNETLGISPPENPSSPGSPP